MTLQAALFRCDGSQTTLTGGFIRLSPRRIVWFTGDTLMERLLGTMLVGKLSTSRGRDVFTLENSATRFVGRLLVR